MKATRALPESYLLYRHFDDTRYKKATWVVIVLGLLVFVASFAFFNSLAGTLRPEYQPVEHLDFALTLERLTILLRLLVPVAVVLILHEGIHALCLWLFTRERPIFVATFEGVGGIAVRLPSWYLPRNAFLVANLAPACSLTLGGLLLLLVMPHSDIGLLVFCNSLNLAGSISDVVSSIYVYLHPPSAYIKTDGRIYHHHKPESVARWKQQLRAVMEWILARLEQSKESVS
jgi:hypothetical protein